MQITLTNLIRFNSFNPPILFFLVMSRREGWEKKIIKRLLVVQLHVAIPNSHARPKSTVHVSPALSHTAPVLYQNNFSEMR